MDFFLGLLWGWDYAKQLGDDRQANTYFKILESIDHSNPVLMGYRAILAIDDSLRRSLSSQDRSRLLLQKGKVLWSVGLQDEAIDSIERSIGEDKSNQAAYLYMGEIFEKTGKPWALRLVRRMMNKENL